MVRTALSLMVILSALALAVVGLAATAFVIGPIGDVEPDIAEMLRFIALGMTLVIGIQSYVMAGVMRRKFAIMASPGARLAQWQSRTLVLAAGAEAAAIFAGVVALLSGWSWHLAPAYVLFAALLIYLWPTGNLAASIAGIDPPDDKYS